MQQLKSVFLGRQKAIAQALAERSICAAVFLDAEGSRSQNVRWLCGMPSDAVLVLSAQGETLLYAWDVNLAHSMAVVDQCLDYTAFHRHLPAALKNALDVLAAPRFSMLELPSDIGYVRFLEIADTIAPVVALCTQEGISSHIAKARAIKDAHELSIYRTLAHHTDAIIDSIESKLRAGLLHTESDVALLIEAECRALGCEGTSFETLAAGPARSWAIHAFPSWGTSSITDNGLTILDFGLKYEGYTSDITITLCVRTLNARQEKLVELVEAASLRARDACVPHASCMNIAASVDALFAQSGYSMPHALGHGLGLDVHEYPFLKNSPGYEHTLEKDMVITLEPGLYDPELGGARLENDFLVTAHGVEQLTHSRIIRM